MYVHFYLNETYLNKLLHFLYRLPKVNKALNLFFDREFSNVYRLFFIIKGL